MEDTKYSYCDRTKAQTFNVLLCVNSLITFSIIDDLVFIYTKLQSLFITLTDTPMDNLPSKQRPPLPGRVFRLSQNGSTYSHSSPTPMDNLKYVDTQELLDCTEQSYIPFIDHFFVVFSLNSIWPLMERNSYDVYK